MTAPKTIRVKAGDQLKLTLKNSLTMPLGNEVENEFRLPNTTNMHLHGGHISGESPGDNVLIMVGPGEIEEYIYDFPRIMLLVRIGIIPTPMEVLPSKPDKP